MELDDKLLEQMERKAALGHGPNEGSTHSITSPQSSETSLDVKASLDSVTAESLQEGEDWLTF